MLPYGVDRLEGMENSRWLAASEDLRPSVQQLKRNPANNCMGVETDLSLIELSDETF